MFILIGFAKHIVTSGKWVRFILPMMFMVSAFDAWSYPEAQLESDWRQIYETWNQKNCVWSSFKSDSGKKTGFTRCGKGAKPVVVIPGYTEPTVKYLETVYDLSEKLPEYGPFYVVELSGQGTSDRLGRSPTLVHVDKDTRYSDDLLLFLETEVRRDGEAKPLVIAHSTGAMVALVSATRKPEQFEKIVALSPLIRPNLPLPVWLVRIIAATYVGLGFDETPVWGQASRPIEDQKFEKNNSTDSKIRWTISHNLLVENPLIFTHGISWAWLKSMIAEGDYVWDSQTRLKTPLLMMRPEKDFYVNGDEADRFCKGAANCQIKVVAGDKHETLQLSDGLRDPVLAGILTFMTK